MIDVANRLQESGLFASASPDFACNGAEISYDSDVYKQWHLYNAQNEGIDINVSPAWNYATGKGVKVAIVDNGVDVRHKDLAANADTTLCYDAVSNRNNVNRIYASKVEKGQDSLSHGTHCAGIAAAVRNNGINGAGVAPDAKIISISCQDYQGVYLARGINWAWQNGADVISCSWGTVYNDAVAEALNNAITKGRNGKGCIIVKSAGNNHGPITWPGDYRPEIITVTAINQNGVIHPQSSYGEMLFVSAPGVDVLSTAVDNSIKYFTGTSMAAPHVAGVVALMLERNSNLNWEQVQEIIAKTTKKVGKEYKNEYESTDYKFECERWLGTWNEHCGYGLIDAYNAVVSTPRE